MSDTVKRWWVDPLSGSEAWVGVGVEVVAAEAYDRLHEERDWLRSALRNADRQTCGLLDRAAAERVVADRRLEERDEAREERDRWKAQAERLDRMVNEMRDARPWLDAQEVAQQLADAGRTLAALVVKHDANAWTDPASPSVRAIRAWDGAVAGFDAKEKTSA